MNRGVVCIASISNHSIRLPPFARESWLPADLPTVPKSCDISKRAQFSIERQLKTIKSSHSQTKQNEMLIHIRYIPKEKTPDPDSNDESEDEGNNEDEGDNLRRVILACGDQ